ncbi:MAG: hypothetical protein U9N56_01430, partial [Actinomycetota bacterium]|nr:hypothetical protein [Actinomycetota bacterium]
MSFRSHVARPMNMSLPSNRLIVGLSAVAGLAGVAIWLIEGSTTALWAPVHTFLAWALVREIDPDHQSAAIAAGIASGLWILAGLDAVGVLMVGALMVAARLVTNSTGRRPLIPDLILIGIFATAVSFTTAGWIAGFGLA